MKVIVFLGLLVVALALKPSEAGVNDWHLNNVGQLRQAYFFKGRVQFISRLGFLGQLDRTTGRLQQRVSASENERIVSQGPLELTLATRYNQLVTYLFRNGQLDRVVDNRFLLDPRRIEWLSRAGKKEYFLTSSLFLEGKSIAREAREGESFLRVLAVEESQGDGAYLVASSLGVGVCVQRYSSGAFASRGCVEESTAPLELHVVEGRLILVYPTVTYVFHTEQIGYQLLRGHFLDLVGSTIVLQQLNWEVGKGAVISRPISSNRAQTVVTLKAEPGSAEVFRDGIRLFSLGLREEQRIHRAWLNFKSQLDFELLVQYTDLEVALIQIGRGQSQVIWNREESLAYIEEALFLKFQQTDGLDNQYHRNLVSHSYRGLSLIEKIARAPLDITLRLLEELNDLQKLVAHLTTHFFQLLANFDAGSLQRFEMSREQEVRYGLRKYLLLSTQKGTLLALDTKTRAILWKLTSETGANRSLAGLIKLQRDYERQVAVRATYEQVSSSGKVTYTVYLEEILADGRVLLLQSFQSTEIPSVFKLGEQALGVKMGERVEVVRIGEEGIDKQFYFYSLSKQEISGWRSVEGGVVRVWNFRTGGDEKILRTASAFRGDQRAHIPLFDKEKVFFKNVDFTNLAVVTSLNHTNIGLYILNGRTGKVQFNQFKNGVNTGLPLNLLYDQNNVLLSYFNARNKIFQIWTVEQFQERFQTSALAMITDYIQHTEYKPHQNRENTIFKSELYGSSVTIKNLYVSESKQSLTRRNLFIITRENKLYTIQRDLVSIRRPRKDSEGDLKGGYFSNQKYPEYAYLIPFVPTNYLSYDLTLATLNQVRFSPTDMQSSLFVFCFGVDAFLVRTAPDKTYDMITQDFNHLILLAILIAATVLILVFRHYIRLAKLRKPHRE